MTDEERTSAIVPVIQDGTGADAPDAALALIRRRFGRIWLVGLLVVFLVVMFLMVRFFVTPIILAAVIATLAWPLQVQMVERLRGHRGTAALFSVIVVVLVVLIPMWVTSNLVRIEVAGLVERAADPFSSWLDRTGDAFVETLETWEDSAVGRLLLSEPMRGIGIADIDAAATLQDIVGTAGNLVARIVNRTYSGAFQLFANLFIVLFTLFYFFRDGERIVARMRYLSPLEERYEQLLVDRLVSVSRATLRGSFLIGVIQGALGGITLALTGVEAPVLWGVVMVILSIVPLLGTWFVMYPIAIIQLLLGNVWQAAVIFIVTVAVISWIDNILRPRLVGRGAGLHDLVIFFTTIGGIAVFGVMGFVVGPVLAAFALALVEVYTLEFGSQLDRDEGGVESTATLPGGRVRWRRRRNGS